MSKSAFFRVVSAGSSAGTLAFIGWQGPMAPDIRSRCRRGFGGWEYGPYLISVMGSCSAGRTCASRNIIRGDAGILGLVEWEMCHGNGIRWCGTYRSGIALKLKNLFNRMYTSY